MEPAGPTLSLAPIPQFLPRLHSPLVSLGLTSYSPALICSHSTPPHYSAVMSALLLPTPETFVLGTRVKVTCPYPVFLVCITLRAVCLMFREYVLCPGAEVMVCSVSAITQCFAD